MQILEKSKKIVDCYATLAMTGEEKSAVLTNKIRLNKKHYLCIYYFDYIF